MKHTLELVCVLSVAIGCVACFALVALDWWKTSHDRLAPMAAATAPFAANRTNAAL